MTPPPLTYPAYPNDVAKEFINREKAISHSLPDKTSIDKTLKRLFDSTPPSESELKLLIETMFFASLATEEGHFTPVGIVFAQDLAMLAGLDWALVRFHSPLDFEVDSISKYASACGKTDALLAVVRNNQKLEVVGIATPPRFERSPLSPTRIIALKPGDISIWHDATEAIRYQRGRILDRKPSVYVGATERYQIGQLDAVRRTVLGDNVARVPGSSVFFDLTRIFENMVRLEHGGLLVILGPDEPDDERDKFLEGSTRLAESLKLGEALREAHEARVAKFEDERRFDVVEKRREPLTEQQERASERVQSAEKCVSWMVAQISRLTTVDGAVVLSHQLEVLAFGVKIPSQSGEDINVRSIDSEGCPGDTFLLDRRGTRHRAAAAFAKNHPKGLAVIVSQDGDAAIFVMHGSELVHRWPLGL